MPEGKKNILILLWHSEKLRFVFQAWHEKEVVFDFNIREN
jgi:hypothetical protein